MFPVFNLCNFYIILLDNTKLKKNESSGENGDWRILRPNFRAIAGVVA